MSSILGEMVTYAQIGLPTSAPIAVVRPIASAPQKVTRSVGLINPAPPALAPIAPRNAKNNSDPTDTTGTNQLCGDRITSARGAAAPTEIVTRIEVRAACTGRAALMLEMPSSSRAWEPRASLAIAAVRLGVRAQFRRLAQHRFERAPPLRNHGRSQALSLSRARSAPSVSDCELTETYSPAAIDIAPATSPAAPAISASFCVDAADATPRIRLAVEMIPSFAPSTAARSQPIRSTRWLSL